MVREWRNRKGYTLHLFRDSTGDTVVTLQGPGFSIQTIRTYPYWQQHRSEVHAEALADAMSMREVRQKHAAA